MFSFTIGRSTKFFLVLALASTLCFPNCKPQRTINPQFTEEMPKQIVWAWERPEDLRFLDSQRFGVAFLAQTLFFDKENVNRVSRRQPLQILDGTYLIAVTRIETSKGTKERSDYSDDHLSQVTDLVIRTMDLPNVRAIQIDFDAKVSEREFYRRLITSIRAALDKKAGTRIPLTITALASWCAGESWYNDLPIDEAIPMVFVMGAETERIRAHLQSGNDWREPLCRGNYGISVDEAPVSGLQPGRRMYYFKNTSWNAEDLQRMQ